MSHDLASSLSFDGTTYVIDRAAGDANGHVAALFLERGEARFARFHGYMDAVMFLHYGYLRRMHEPVALIALDEESLVCQFRTAEGPQFFPAPSACRDWIGRTKMLV